jgi:NAD(P)-dependent dehydrogenase (short-subunit alcohol dehydrogenase family)
MSKTVWLITGAGRGMGTGIAKAALAGGIVGQEFCSAYSASKFGLEGWIESLAPEVAPFGIRTMVVEPGFFRTDLLTPESTTYAEPLRTRWSSSSARMSRRSAGSSALTRSRRSETRAGT